MCTCISNTHLQHRTTTHQWHMNNGQTIRLLDQVTRNRLTVQMHDLTRDPHPVHTVCVGTCCKCPQHHVHLIDGRPHHWNGVTTTASKRFQFKDVHRRGVVLHRHRVRPRVPSFAVRPCKQRAVRLINTVGPGIGQYFMVVVRKGSLQRQCKRKNRLQHEHSNKTTFNANAKEKTDYNMSIHTKRASIDQTSNNKQHFKCNITIATKISVCLHRGVHAQQQMGL